MKADPYSEDLLVRYLLGALPEEEQVAVEARAFQDQQYLRNIQAVESELIDAYVRGELALGERQQFEDRFFASAERRRKVEFARALARVAPEFGVTEKKVKTPRRAASVSWQSTLEAFLRGFNSTAKFGLAAALLLLLIGGSWLIIESLRLRAQLAESRAEQQSRERDRQALQQQVADEQARLEELATQLQREREHSEQLAAELQSKLAESATAPSPSAIVSLVLGPGLSRSSEARARLTLPQSASRVRVQVGIEPEENYRSFRVEVRGPGGELVWTQNDLPARRLRAGRAVIVDLPARLLRAGAHELALKGVTGEGATEAVGYHYFDVLKK